MSLPPAAALSRYAIYFAPASNSPWWQAGCRWLGRDPEHQLDGLDATTPLRGNARRYGFHTTLKAPFRLADGCDEARLQASAQRFAAQQAVLTVPLPAVRLLGNFLALQADAAVPEISALAQRCVVHFDALRAPLTPDELARRLSAPLTSRQQALLQQWGYPYTGEEFRFHMTLSDSLTGVAPTVAQTMAGEASAAFAEAMATPLVIDGIAIFRERENGAPFELMARYGFGGSPG
ncbi:DUF1045 domain-containing protein [Actimicrobium sp. CCC2.4]|uniref:DUF1045 domain-containing protein n=1 Tax=Actimicrobium sp. CCC2.4 TaxID=3048606 RepID=UPI002AC9A738|nr:DUF1045 domain-containing protein [Actimicrobium sp. CCC2.4]MEB0136015.1 DUF1045 domain-containing protein [Actimicrobium sp. CCC2.4]WPX32678.1 DUF1045 domain-containing protein [Actimicrobium sp. CCC2.4]